MLSAVTRCSCLYRKLVPATTTTGAELAVPAAANDVAVSAGVRPPGALKREPAMSPVELLAFVAFFFVLPDETRKSFVDRPGPIPPRLE